MDGAEDLLASDIVEQISTIKKEVDALQIAAAREERPWYKSVPTIIAAIAVVISVVSSLDNYYRNVTIDNYRLREEVKDIIVRLSSNRTRCISCK